MARKRHTPEQIIRMLPEGDVVLARVRRLPGLVGRCRSSRSRSRWELRMLTPIYELTWMNP